MFDEFHFAYKTLRGDGSIIARIDAVEHVHDLTKAGIMVRNTLDPASENVAVFVTPLKKIAVQHRTTLWGSTSVTITDANSMTLPHWVRLTRKGNQFTTQHSNDGVQWEAIVDPQDPNKPSSLDVSMNETVYIGLAVTSHNTTRAAEARISNVKITGSALPDGPFIHSEDIAFEIPHDNGADK